MDFFLSGYIAKIIVPEGTKDIPLGTLLCVQVENAAEVAAFVNFIDEGCAMFMFGLLIKLMLIGYGYMI